MRTFWCIMVPLFCGSAPFICYWLGGGEFVRCHELGLTAAMSVLGIVLSGMITVVFTDDLCNRRRF